MKKFLLGYVIGCVLGCIGTDYLVREEIALKLIEAKLRHE